MTTTWENLEKPGTIIGGWDYEEEDMDYDQVLDVDTGNAVLYEGLGLSQNWNNEAPKPTTTFTNESPKATTVFTNINKI